MITYTVHMNDSYPGECLMVDAIEEARDWAHNMASPQIFVCWL